MEKHSDFIEPVTPKFPYNWNVEDSGYHTSFTPGSFECSDITDENYQHNITSRWKSWHYVEDSNGTPDCNIIHFQNSNNKSIESPHKRRGIKRSYPEEIENTDITYSTILTPTSNISGELNRLKFSESKKNNPSITSHKEYDPSVVKCDPYPSDSYYYATIPTTPIKRKCKNGCKLYRSKKNYESKRNLNLETHSITCDEKALEIKVKSEEKKPKPFHKYNVKPNQKIDIIKMLHQTINVLPPLEKIFSYLNNEDILNFTLVSQDWRKIWDEVGEPRKKEKQVKYQKDIIESQENRKPTPKLREIHISRPLIEIQNVCYENVLVNPSVSPSKSPRTIKFNRFTEAATSDVRRQLSCMKCQRPAKITEETSGEEWAECTNLFCSFQFCSMCKSPRHPGKLCFQFDLDGPSPSKRTSKQNKCVAGSKKSRQKLKRLNW